MSGNKRLIVSGDQNDSIDVVQGHQDLHALAEDEKFMNEPVQIMVMETTDENANAIPEISVGLDKVLVRRGLPVWVRRKHVEVLARCKETRFRQPQRDMMNPEAGNELLGSSALVYPFTVLEDKNPRGGPWLRKILSEPA